MVDPYMYQDSLFNLFVYILGPNQIGSGPRPTSITKINKNLVCSKFKSTEVHIKWITSI